MLTCGFCCGCSAWLDTGVSGLDDMIHLGVYFMMDLV